MMKTFMPSLWTPAPTFLRMFAPALRVVFDIGVEGVSVLAWLRDGSA